MSTIAAGTTSGTALVSTGDTTGALQLQVNGTTASVTLAANGSVGVGSTPSYGTNGQLLTSSGTGSAPTWTTFLPISGISTDLSFKDYFLTVSAAVCSAAAADIFMQAVSLDGTSELLIINGNSTAHAVVYNTSTDTFGTPVLVRASNVTAVNSIALAKISSTAVLVCSLLTSNTALETVVLTVSGSTITVGTALATTLAASSTLIVPNTRLVVVGSSYILNYFTTADSLPKFRAITVSGSTPSIGAELAYAGGTASDMHHSYSHSATVLLHFSSTSSVAYVLPITVSGTTLTAGTQATVVTTSSTFVTGVLSSSRYALCFLNTTGRGAVVSVAGSVATISTAATTMSVSSWNPIMQVFSNQAFIQGGQSVSDNINIITDTAGVATLGTDLALLEAGFFVSYLSTGKVLFGVAGGSISRYYQYGISSGSPVLEKSFQNVVSTTVLTTQTPIDAPYKRPLSGLPQSGSGFSVMLRTSAGKAAPAGTNYNSSSAFPFTLSIDGTGFAKIQQAANPVRTFNDGISEAVAWGLPFSQSGTTTTVQIRKVTLV